MSVLTMFRPSFIRSARTGLRYLSAAQATPTTGLLFYSNKCAAPYLNRGPLGLPLKEGAPAPLPSEDKPLSPKVAALVEEIVNLSLLDVADLNKALKKRLNIADQPLMPAGMMMAAAQTQNGVQPEAPKEAEHDTPQKMTFSVKLTKFDDAKKIAIIKEIRALVPGLNLVQAKKVRS
ncbi:hypothetical protein OESDEN_08096 [Oesophagostomum dentatum]|uniref:Ribosomal protein L7/L12 domain protein n=1 Tax=Oesophagostomum dentatum TaxID=61180 RepID=A0A0B1T463_OESDE|nr:hypothetical protein OESDEN_08096 [Oesophagostomum dentatum]